MAFRPAAGGTPLALHPGKMLAKRPANRRSVALAVVTTLVLASAPDTVRAASPTSVAAPTAPSTPAAPAGMTPEPAVSDPAPAPTPAPTPVASPEASATLAAPTPSPAPALADAPAPVPTPVAPPSSMSKVAVAGGDAPMPIAAEASMHPATNPHAPPPVVYEPPRRRGDDPVDRSIVRQRRAGLGLSIAGFSLFGVGYVGAALVGTENVDAGREADDPYQVAYGQRLLIPVVGPFAAAAVTPTATEGFMTVLAGTVQVAGLAMGIAGAVMIGKAKRRSRNLALGAVPAPGGGSLHVHMSF